MQIWCGLEKEPWSYVCTHEKAGFFLPVNILTVWSPVFLAARRGGSRSWQGEGHKQGKL